MILGLLLFGWKLWRERHDEKPLDLTQAIWLVPWFGGLCLLSWLGQFGGGLDLLSPMWGSLAVAVFALALFPLTIALRLPAERSAAYVAEDHLDADPPSGPPAALAT